VLHLTHKIIPKTAVSSFGKVKDFYFCQKSETMGGHKEAEQNEIGGPVVFALILFAITIAVIYFVS
jgi:hypothetical protein